MNYGFVIDNRRCIGCHACSTACKSENEVALGVSRTWVKYTEVGKYPDVKRHFQVTRCNHCANPPCVRICPVTAMYQRDDGIVEFDSDVCIGCKACMQACPYDAIHIDPNKGTAAKCHFCSHRVEVGMEPACVVVCPEHAIIAGDMDDPDTEISKVLAANSVTVRKPEQGTAPKLFYIDGHDASLTPTATSDVDQDFMWSENLSEQTKGMNKKTPQKKATATAQSGVKIRTPQTQGYPDQGPIALQGTRAEQMVQVSYNANHKIPWHWQVPAYLVTKGIAAGIFLFLAVAFITGWAKFDGYTTIISGGAMVFFTLLTTALLVADLERPERFLRIIFRPQMKSWLTRGAFILIAFSTVTGIWWALELGTYFFPDFYLMGDGVRNFVLWLGLPLAFGASIYTAFLFGQAEGRDLWQSPLLPIHLLVQTSMAGSGMILLLNAVFPFTVDITSAAHLTLIVSLVLDLVVTLFGEFGMPHPSEHAAKAAHMITSGCYKNHFWYGSIVAGHVLPLILLCTSSSAAAGIAGLAMLIGLYLYEHAFVMAPQRITNS